MAESNTIGTLKYDVVGDTSKLSAGIKGLESQATKSAGNISSAFERSFSSLKSIIAGGVLVGITKHILDVGIAAQTTETQFRTAFGSMARSEQRWATTHARSMHMSSQATDEMLARFKTLFDQQGYAAQAASKHSEAITKLIADISSYKNLPIEDVSNKIYGALATGRTRGLASIGISITAMGSAAQTTAGRMNTLKQIFEKSSYMQGASGLDTTRNSVEDLKAGLEELTEQIAKGLNPVIKDMIGPITAVVDSLTAADKATSGWLSKLSAWTIVAVLAVRTLGLLKAGAQSLGVMKLGSWLFGTGGAAAGAAAGGGAAAAGGGAVPVVETVGAAAAGSSMGSTVKYALASFFGALINGLKSSKMVQAIKASANYVWADLKFAARNMKSIGGDSSEFWSPGAGQLLRAIPMGFRNGFGSGMLGLGSYGLGLAAKAAPFVGGIYSTYQSWKPGLHKPMEHEDFNTIAGSAGVGFAAGPLGALITGAIGGTGVLAKHIYGAIVNRRIRGEENAWLDRKVGFGIHKNQSNRGRLDDIYSKGLHYDEDLKAVFGDKVDTSNGDGTVSISSVQRYIASLPKRKQAEELEKLRAVMAKHHYDMVAKDPSLKAYQVVAQNSNDKDREAAQTEMDKAVALQKNVVLHNYANLGLGIDARTGITESAKDTAKLALEKKADIYALRSDMAKTLYHTNFGDLTKKDQTSLLGSQDYKDQLAVINGEYANKQKAVDIKASQERRDAQIADMNAVKAIESADARLRHDDYKADLADISIKYNTERGELEKLAKAGIDVKKRLMALDKQAEQEKRAAYEAQLERTYNLREAIAGHNSTAAAGYRTSIYGLADTLRSESNARTDMGILGLGVHSPFSVQSAQAKRDAEQKKADLDKEKDALAEQQIKLTESRDKLQREIEYRQKKGDLKPGELESMQGEVNSYNSQISANGIQQGKFGDRRALIDSQLKRDLDNVARSKAETQNDAINGMLPRLSYLQGLIKYGDTSTGRDKADRDERLRQLELDKSAKIKGLQNLELSTSDKQTMLNALDADFSRRAYDINNEEKQKMQQRVGFVGLDQVWQSAAVEGIKTGFAAPNVDRKLQEDQLNTLKSIDDKLGAIKGVNIDQLNKLDGAMGMAA